MILTLLVGVIVAFVAASLQAKYRAIRVIALSVGEHVITLQNEANLENIRMSTPGAIASFLMPTQARFLNLAGQFVLPITFLVVFKAELAAAFCGLILGNLFARRLPTRAFDRHALVNELYRIVDQKKKLTTHSNRSNDWVPFIFATELSLDYYQNDLNTPEKIYPSEEWLIMKRLGWRQSL